MTSSGYSRCPASSGENTPPRGRLTRLALPGLWSSAGVASSNPCPSKKVRRDLASPCWICRLWVNVVPFHKRVSTAIDLIADVDRHDFAHLGASDLGLGTPISLRRSTNGSSSTMFSPYLLNCRMLSKTSPRRWCRIQSAGLRVRPELYQNVCDCCYGSRHEHHEHRGGPRAADLGGAA